MRAQQLFQRGDLVKIAADLGPGKSHFEADCRAVVEYSYAEKYGGSNTTDYSLYIQGKGSVSWYAESELELIDRDRWELREQWEKDKVAEIERKSDRTWIFNNGAEVAQKPHAATVQALADDLGLGSLWGERGEGWVYFSNFYQVLVIANPFLLSGDLKGWEKLCKGVRKSATVGSAA